MRAAFFLLPLLGACTLLFSANGNEDVRNDAASAIEVIVDNNLSGTVSSGTWGLATAANDHYESQSEYATVGGGVDVYRFTPDLPVTSDYEVFAWNSCFSPRHNEVPHTIVFSEDSRTINVDQDCFTGSSGEWFSLGIFRFDAGRSGYLEISDQGLSSPTETYIGADAIRFVSR